MACSGEGPSTVGQSNSQKAYTISGVPIIFPYKAYPPQISMMDKIVKCLNKKYNCLLESPTGSGKSLALLCASLGWLRKTEKEIKEFDNALNKHLNSHGVVVPDNNNSEYDAVHKSAIDLEKYKFGNSKNKSPSEVFVGSLNKDSTGEKFSVLKSPYFKNATDCKTENQIYFNHSSKIDDLKFESPQCCNDGLKKRGIVFIDDDDDLGDFQPLKKNKLFIVTQDVQDKTMPPDSKFLSSDKTSPQRNDTYIPTRDHVGGSVNADSSSSMSAKNISENLENNSLPSKLPKIYFGTRTHKQIGQIIRELKKTSYKNVKMTLLSSRERTCIHPQNSRSRNKNEGCDELINREGGPGCRYYSNLKRAFYCRPAEMESAFDLEDFVSTCKRKHVCPYFGARELLAFSEIVFCPYNYLVDPLIRSALSISLKGNIIIMDEAHNIEDSAREAASGKVSISQLQECISDVLQIGQIIEDDSEPYMHIAKVLENLKKWLENSQNLNEYVTFDSSCKVWSGDDMIAFLDYVGLGPDTYPIFRSKYSKIVSDESENDREKPPEAQVPKLSGSAHMCLKTLNETLNYLYKDDLKYVPDYRCVVMKSRTYSDENSVFPYSQSAKRKSLSNPGFEITINFWCLNPAVAFSDFKNVHSIIVASGTLAPLTSFQSELGIPFQISLEANHVISKEQIWVGTIGKGPGNVSLNANFQNASTFAFQDDVGNLILNICSIIPHGVLCFLPSYGMLDKLVNRWQLTGLWDKLLCKKVVVCEPRQGNADFMQVMQDFYDAVQESETNESMRGALFFAVCRGKVSEGLDFADNNARAVITIGIPFPNVKDVFVDLKKKYNDMYSSKRQIVTGSAWYEMQAFRALNQALGRCIRHKDDFGALIIVDERFQKYDRYTTALSKWIKKEICHYFNFQEAFNSLNEFADRMGLKDCSEMD